MKCLTIKLISACMAAALLPFPVYAEGTEDTPPVCVVEISLSEGEGADDSQEQSQPVRPEEQKPVYEIQVVDLGHDELDYAALQDDVYSSYPLADGQENLEGWRHYDIPEKYRKNGGNLPDPVQVYIYTLCKQYNLRYSVVLAIIELESSYQHDKVTKKKELGYMQVYYKWHKDRLEETLTEEQMLDPYVNVQLGISFLAELRDRFKTEAEYITAYNMGARGAKKHFKKTGTKTSDYAKKVLKTAKRIEKELSTG